MLAENNIKTWAVEDQPLYKLYTKGAKHLSDVELLAIIIQHGTANQNAMQIARALLSNTSYDLFRFSQLSIQEILNFKIKGVGKTKATRIVAAIEIGSRRIQKRNQNQSIGRSQDVVQHLQNMLQFENKECFVILLLNQANKIIHEEIISEGGITSTIADPRIIFRLALSHAATSLIVCHNHPSGQLRPSKMDNVLTEKVKQGSQYFDINLLDHIIVSNEGYYSYAENQIDW